MKRILFSFLTCLFLLSPLSYAYSSTGEDCLKAHNLTNEEATELVRKINPALNVSDVRCSPVEALWEVTISTGGQKLLGYIDFSKQYFIFGQIFEIKGNRNITQERLTDINKVDPSVIPLADALVLGDKDAKNRIIVFDDPG